MPVRLLQPELIRPVPVPVRVRGSRNPLRVVLLVACAFSLLYSLVMPPFQSPDEHGHFFRAYEITRGNFFPMTDEPLPRSIIDTFARYPSPLESVRRTTVRGLWREAFQAPEPGSEVPARIAPDVGVNYVQGAVMAANLYFPVVYLPAAAGVGLVRLLGGTPLQMLYAARAADICVLLLALWLVWFLAPEIRALAVAVALLPTTLHQAGSVTADILTIALSWIAFALVLRTRNTPVSRRFLAGLACLFALLALCKISVWALPLALLVPTSQFGSMRRRLAWFALVGIMMAGVAASWQIADRSAMEGVRETRAAEGKFVEANFNTMRQHPVLLVRQISLAFIQPRVLGSRMMHMVAAFGVNRFTLPLPLDLLYLAALLAIGALEPLRVPLIPFERLALWLLTVGAILFLLVAVYATDATCSDLYSISSCFNFWSIQGRYFVPFLFAPLVAMRLRNITVPPELLLRLALSVAVIVNLVGVAKVYHHFYM